MQSVGAAGLRFVWSGIGESEFADRFRNRRSDQRLAAASVVSLPGEAGVVAPRAASDDVQFKSANPVFGAKIMDIDKIISTFVESVQRNGGTISLRTIPSVVNELEERLSFRLPYSYRRLILTYEFLPFEIGALQFFGAFGAKDDPGDISCRLFLDAAFVSVLLPRWLFHFANTDTGAYDPVCVDLSTPGSIDGPVVVLDHEAILCESKVLVVKRLALSLQQFMADASHP